MSHHKDNNPRCTKCRRLLKSTKYYTDPDKLTIEPVWFCQNTNCSNYKLEIMIEPPPPEPPVVSLDKFMEAKK